MKRLVAALALVVGLTLSAASGAGAEPGIPACADIIDATPAYHGPDAEAGFENTVTAKLTLASSSCRNVAYTMWVVTYDADGQLSGFAGADMVHGDGTSAILPATRLFTVRNVTAPYACAFFTTSTGRTVYDVAPDSACPSSFDATNPDNLAPSGQILAPTGDSPGGSFPYN